MFVKHLRGFGHIFSLQINNCISDTYEDLKEINDHSISTIEISSVN